VTKLGDRGPAGGPTTATELLRGTVAGVSKPSLDLSLAPLLELDPEVVDPRAGLLEWVEQEAARVGVDTCN
jgi:hypothetical protein